MGFLPRNLIVEDPDEYTAKGDDDSQDNQNNFQPESHWGTFIVISPGVFCVLNGNMTGMPGMHLGYFILFIQVRIGYNVNHSPVIKGNFSGSVLSFLFNNR